MTPRRTTVGTSELASLSAYGWGADEAVFKTRDVFGCVEFQAQPPAAGRGQTLNADAEPSARRKPA